MPGMLSSIRNLFSWGPRYPSALLAVVEKNGIAIMHLNPEDGDIERWGIYPGRGKLRFCGAFEVSRELLGTTTFRGEEWALSVLEDFEESARKKLSSIPDAIADNGQGLRASIPLTCLVDEILRPVGLEFLSEKEKRVPTQDKEAPRAFSVFIVYVSRSRPGRIATDAALSSVHS